MVWFNVADNGDMRRFLKIPKLETGKFIDYDRMRGELIKDIKGGNTNVADEISVLFAGIQQGFDYGTSSTFTFGSSDADNAARAVVKEIFGDA